MNFHAARRTNLTRLGFSSRRRASAFSPSLSARAFVLLFPSARAALLATTAGLIHGRPGACFRRLFRDSSFLISLFDVFGLSLLLISITASGGNLISPHFEGFEMVHTKSSCQCDIRRITTSSHEHPPDPRLIVARVEDMPPTSKISFEPGAEIHW